MTEHETRSDATGFSTSSNPAGQLNSRLDAMETKLDDLVYNTEQIMEKLADLSLTYNTGYSIED